MVYEPPVGILTDTAILEGIASQAIRISPWTPEQLNSVSYDLTLGDEVAVYSDWVLCDETWEQRIGVRDGSDLVPIDRVMDVKDEPAVFRWKIDPDRGWVCKPGIGYLMHVRETIHTTAYEPIIDGKSSIGRLFVKVHFTAGFGDPNFNGQFTLEVEAKHPIRVYPGMRIAQVRFHTLEGTLGKPYDGNYVGASAQGAVESRAWRQFKNRPIRRDEK